MRIFICISFTFCVSILQGQEEIILGPSSQVYPGIPKGVLTSYEWSSNIYKGTVRDYSVYVPAQYDGTAAAALMIFQDGHTYLKEDGDFRVPTVFDNLIAQEKMPITIGLFINPGHDQDLPPPASPWRASNRSIEYDTLSDTYTRFLLEELIPELKKKYVISDNPKMYAIAGISSGGICAFTAAWNRPEAFHKVLSHIGSYTDIRGGHQYPSLIRKSDRKPIKVFMQDGTNDLDNKFGNWFLANQQMAKALHFKDYDYQFVIDSGAHNGKNAGLILPQSLIWLWNDVVPPRLDSKKYAAHMTGASEINLFMGETRHLAHISCDHLKLEEGEEIVLKSGQEAQLIIIHTGMAEVRMGAKTSRLSKNSVVFIEVGEEVSVGAISDNMQFLKINLQGRSDDNAKKENKVGNSFSVDFNELEFKQTSKGGRRDYFRRSTRMFPYFEMHMTTLAPGLRSHLPHTHEAEELIIMVSGETEEEIGNALFHGTKGDIYYLGAQVPHGIKNVGRDSCCYFAFQWK